MRTTHKDLYTRAASALLCDMLMVVCREGPQKLLESRSCFTDAARCQASLTLCCTPHAFRTSSWCEEVRSVLITRQALGQGRTHVHGHRRSRCEVRQIW